MSESSRSSSVAVARPSDLATDSVALMVKLSVQRIQEDLELACCGGVADIFAIARGNKTTFPSGFEKYSTQVSVLEERLCQYLTVRKQFVTGKMG